MTDERGKIQKKKEDEKIKGMREINDDESERNE